MRRREEAERSVGSAVSRKPGAYAPGLWPELLVNI